VRSLRQSPNATAALWSMGARAPPTPKD
jgi:hypothetical protein